MAETEPTPLSALLDPPLADPPPLAELERRAGRLRQRRWAGRGAGAAAVIALVAGAVAVAQPGGEQTVRTASPPPIGSAGGLPAVEGSNSAPSASFHEFQAGAQTWRLAFVANPDLCVTLSSGSVVRTGICWDGGPLLANAVEIDGTTYVVGMASDDVSEVSAGPARPGDLLPIVGTTAGTKVFFRQMPDPDRPASVELVAATPSDPRAYVRTVTLHGRSSDINGQASAASPPSTSASTQGPTVTVTNPPTTASLDTPVSTVVATPTTTIPGSPPGGNPQRVQVVPGAASLRRHVFETAFASSTSSLAVRFWDGVEPCSVLGRVDVAESADTVTITLWTGIGPGAESMSCVAMAVYKEVLVSLSAPLGSRTIVDGAA